ncbi:ABC transporter permease [Acidithiobacillus thiooxidans]|uniref:Putative phospholipid ABC transporter permease protein MlaE n=1 Tax=Acidithiobacillus thiooxidans ATCC 19377 TaxID=637390 RepID=A0A543Q2W4_ACITH|nr:ABC transporter permease [Acidithiobacillus thiooxidans]MDX5935243.1 ABC transporter permease [Acidithiobacillus thiooxidans]TQN50620.1 putative phospholipid ABC transporter permease protein MlaE [Acidithiobacillus thiooxidans ATCC 19377]
MTDHNPQQPRWQLQEQTITLSGRWTLRRLGGSFARQQKMLGNIHADLLWDLRNLEALDSAGALLLWQVWGNRFPEKIQLNDLHQAIFTRLADLQPLTHPPRRPFQILDALGAFLVETGGDLWGIFLLMGALLLEFGRGLRHPRSFPWREISATIVSTGPSSLPILTLIGFLIGVVISFQSASTLAQYGANIYIVNIAGLSILREFGPLITAIILSGRSGSAFTAQIGAMRVTEELDALRTFGIPPIRRLVLPKVIALALVVPLLVLWTDMVGIFGAMLVAKANLGISYHFFIQEMPVAVPSFNLWLGIIKGAVFGILIAWIAGFHGLKVKPNTTSLSRETTNSVVFSITLVILIDAILALVFANTGIS